MLAARQIFFSQNSVEQGVAIDDDELWHENVHMLGLDNYFCNVCTPMIVCSLPWMQFYRKICVFELI